MTDPLLICPEKKPEAPKHVLNPTPLKISTPSSQKNTQQPFTTNPNISHGINSQASTISTLATKEKGSAFKVL